MLAMQALDKQSNNGWQWKVDPALSVTTVVEKCDVAKIDTAAITEPKPELEELSESEKDDGEDEETLADSDESEAESAPVLKEVQVVLHERKRTQQQPENDEEPQVKKMKKHRKRNKKRESSSEEEEEEEVEEEEEDEVEEEPEEKEVVEEEEAEQEEEEEEKQGGESVEEQEQVSRTKKRKHKHDHHGEVKEKAKKEKRKRIKRHVEETLPPAKKNPKFNLDPVCSLAGFIFGTKKITALKWYTRFHGIKSVDARLTDVEEKQGYIDGERCEAFYSAHGLWIIFTEKKTKTTSQRKRSQDNSAAEIKYKKEQQDIFNSLWFHAAFSEGG